MIGLNMVSSYKQLLVVPCRLVSIFCAYHKQRGNNFLSLCESLKMHTLWGNHIFLKEMRHDQSHKT